MSPFVLLDYHPPFQYPPTGAARGVGVHPHKGFETVTVAWKGKIAHHDSAGNSGVIGPGDVQWMTAGAGVLHKEYHEQEWARTGGILHMAQIWVNLPRAHKTTPPKYQDIAAGQMGRADLPNGGGFVRIIAGEYQGVKGPASTFTPLNLLDIRLNEGGRATLSYPAHYNTAVLVAQGAIHINGEIAAPEHTFVVFRNEPGEITLGATAPETMVLVLNGEPINEPAVQYGPFVLNSKEEIAQAFQEVRSGKFGHLDD